MTRFKAASAVVAMTLLANASFAQERSSASPDTARLQQVASFEHQVTGVTVSKDGRIFVNFPRWTEDAPISVAEVTRDGQIKPYPDEEWNSWRNDKKNQMSAGDHFVCVQSVVTDAHGGLWVVDPAAPATASIVAGGPKLVRIDLNANKVAQVIRFDETVAPQGSYLNDVRFSPDGRHAYLTDAGAKGALVVVDLRTGKARRVLNGHPSTQPEKDVVVKTDGHELRRPDGRGVEFAADSLALSPDGRTLYWKALTGRTLYRIATSALQNPRLSAKDLVARVERVAETEPTDGVWIDERGRLYVSAIEQDAVKVRDGDRVTTLVQDKRLRWPDTFSEGPDGTIYVTSSRIQDMSWFKLETGPRLETQLWRIEGTGPRQ
ncbi:MULTISPECIES: SMP-30/gluconolactonase/LRE family protein [unclassified Caballeronia]|uniref:SMP-30/gluconolactonase/LRE family protein n=1 Tax=unclassified Caballeronia TaxID=2646786 RepID=UPI001F48A8B5|nr:MULTISPECIES: major royal jelly family protein [unclassified Caballeronia]MCE4547336.1 major royal jelly family protein [Caballeronia sp. PC1]MCE4575319.1 major royal jelly family protein [Caballeronia sp. CLC5]